MLNYIIKRLFLLIPTLLGITFITGCAKEEKEQGVLRLRLKEDPTTLDPLYIVDVAGGSIAAKLYSGLFRYDENCRIIPDLAESWEISPDACTYTFSLYKDCGITAEDVKNAFERLISIDTFSPRAWIFEKVREFKVVDSYTLAIILKEPYAPFICLLTMPNAYVEKAGGPYKLNKWEHDQYLLLRPNPDYFGQKPKLKGIEYKIIPDEFTAKTEFEIGGLDIIEVNPIDWQRHKNTYSQTGLNIYYIGFNCQREPFNLVQVRQALNYAIDKQTIINHMLYGQAEEAHGPVPPALSKTKVPPYPYLPNRAKRMLKGVRIPKPLRLYVRAESQGIGMAEAIQHYLSRIDIKTEITPLEWSAFKEAVNDGAPDLFLMSWWADYPHCENFLYPTFHSSNFGAGGNRVRFKNSAIDKLITKAQKENNQEVYERLQRLITRQAPWLFLWHRKELVAVKPWVKGFKLYPVYNSDKGLDVDVVR